MTDVVRQLDAKIAQSRGFEWLVYNGYRFLSPPGYKLMYGEKIATGDEPLFGDWDRYVPHYSTNPAWTLRLLAEMHYYDPHSLTDMTWYFHADSVLAISSQAAELWLELNNWVTILPVVRNINSTGPFCWVCRRNGVFERSEERVYDVCDRHYGDIASGLLIETEPQQKKGKR